MRGMTSSFIGPKCVLFDDFEARPYMIIPIESTATTLLNRAYIQ
jgi:hypothetical protein